MKTTCSFRSDLHLDSFLGQLITLQLSQNMRNACLTYPLICFEISGYTCVSVNTCWFFEVLQNALLK